MPNQPFLQLATARRSVRRYQPLPAPRQILERCLEAARLAPSAMNAQSCSYILVDDPPLRDAVSRFTFNAVVSFNRWTLSAPAFLVILNQSSSLARVGATLQGRSWQQVDTGLAAAHFCLQAAEEGLGTCILGWFNEQGIKRLLGIQREYRVALLVTVGYSAEEPSVKERKPLSAILRYNREGE